MPVQVILRCLFIAVALMSQAKLPHATAAIQSTPEHHSTDWQSSVTGSTIVQPTKSTDLYFRSGPRTSQDAAPGPTGDPNPDAESPQPLSLTEYFDTLAPEDKAKFGWSLPSGWRLEPFGMLRGEMIYSQNPLAADAVLFFYTPDNLDVDDDTFTVHGKTSMFNLLATGPEVCGWKTGGAVIINFLGPQPLRNGSGFNVVNAYGYLERGDWKISFGRMSDLFGPIGTNTVNMGQQRAAGNIGIYRGAFNVDRIVQNNPNAKWKFSGRVSQNTVNDYLILPTARGTDNGFPNFEGRIGLELGAECDGVRPVEIGVSGLWGETRAFDPARIDVDQNEIIFLGALQEVSRTAGVNIDLQLRGKRVGVRGEFWVAQAAGTYFVGILQTLNSETGRGIRSIGGWIETYFKYNSCTTFHVGGGIDDPRNQDVGFITNAVNDPGQRLYNHVVWTNILYDVTKSFQLGYELSYRKTHYLNPIASSSGWVSHFSSSLKYYERGRQQAWASTGSGAINSPLPRLGEQSIHLSRDWESNQFTSPETGRGQDDQLVERLG